MATGNIYTATKHVICTKYIHYKIVGFLFAKD